MITSTGPSGFQSLTSPRAKVSRGPASGSARAASIISAELSIPRISAPGQRRASAAVSVPGPQPRSATTPGASAPTRPTRSKNARARSSPNRRYSPGSHTAASRVSISRHQDKSCCHGNGGEILMSRDTLAIMGRGPEDAQGSHELTPRGGPGQAQGSHELPPRGGPGQAQGSHELRLGGEPGEAQARQHLRLGGEPGEAQASHHLPPGGEPGDGTARHASEPGGAGAGAGHRPLRDEVEELVAGWRAERPDLDVEPLEVLSRVSRLARHLDRARTAAFATHGLQAWEFDVLSALRRQGPPYQLSPGGLLRATLVTSGTMTNRIDRLASAGL